MNECMSMMGGMGGMMSGMFVPWLLTSLLFTGLATLGAILVLRGNSSGGWRGGETQALQLLNTRLAAGDIDVQEYEQRRRLIAQK